jgi:hypothetical protein
MMEKLLASGAALARVAEERHIEALESRLPGELRGVQVERAPGQVILKGRSLLRRWIADPAIRFIGAFAP